MRNSLSVFIVFLYLLLAIPAAQAHFGMIIPSDNMVMPDEPRSLHLELSFSHPFEMIGMDMARPDTFGVVARGQKVDLTQTLAGGKVMNKSAWQADYAVKKPGIYTFYMQPSPYWEPAENCYIVHHTKTVVAAFGVDEGWDHEIGLETEIVPLAKPFGQYAGNLFQGIVKVKGKPLPWAEVEVEYYNRDNRYQAPCDYMVTQTVKADANGVFSYACPMAGWWGFAALTTSSRKMPHADGPKDVELGAVLWVHFEEVTKK